MSKKLIAVASAAALALSALVAAPASAAAFAITVDGELTGSGIGTSATTAWKVAAPAADSIVQDGATGTTGTALRLTIATTTATGSVSATTTGGVKLLTKTQYDTPAKVSDATANATVAAVSESATLYVISTSTTAGTVTITNDGNTAVLYVVATAGPAYKLALTGPASIGAGATGKITGTVTDVFGNKIESLLKGAFTVNVVGAGTAASNTVWRSATKDYSIELTGASTGGGVAATVALTNTPTEYATLGSPITSQFFNLSTVDLSVQVTALTAQVAALTADYNALATKYNKLVKKSKRVAKK